MRPLLKFAKWFFVLLLGGVLVLAACLLSVRAYRQSANARAFAISTANGINESGYVRIGGIDQWVQIRGENRDNPVLLCLHGGPGGTWLPLTNLFRSWEKEFTVVFWDQRGAGKTLKATGESIAATMTVARMTQDGLELAEHLRTRLGKQKIVLLGHSFGSVLGVRMVRQRPDLFHAFVGTGQVSDLPRALAMEYARLQDQARQAADAETVRTLELVGPPPFRNLKQVAAFFEQAGKYQPAADNVALAAMRHSLLSPPPDYSLRDEVNRFRGFAVVPPWKLYDELLNTRLAALGTDFQVPVFFIHGGQDRVAPASLAEEYFKSITAPHKEMIVLPSGGHFAVWSHAEEFLQELVKHVRPVAG